ncbi:tripartite ATP-independent transporter DctM subunit [Prauserella sediminis]|uniref:Tripartite ATP-independent transporter DctM subunit n=1 Tax=Prauserella sediminis TaxID=577680 RepID=A0A839XVW7_9PSEU|nr:TRAP transporter large permease subunit [Prauserella sediminis]MBB3665524.1 tripartite ATP-independent transporter DctM subunit [Prauserella sediminis]
MSTVELFLVVVGILAGCLLVGMRIALALTFAGFVGYYLLDGWDVGMSTLGALPIESASKFTLLVIPMFVLLGNAAERANLAEGAYRVLGWFLRGLPGGLAVATLTACACFAAVSGSSIATVISIGNLAITEMRKAGYAMHVAAGVVGAAGTLGVLIPPSVPLVIYGVLTGEPIGALLMAGIGPGVVTATVYGVSIMIRAKRKPELFGKGAEEVLPLSDRPALLAGVYSLFRIGLLFVIVIGGMYSGLFTAVEAAAVGAFVAVLMVIIEHLRKPRELRRNLWGALTAAVSLNGMVFSLLIGGAIFSSFMVAAGAPQLLTDGLTGLSLPAWLIVALLLIVLVPMGMFLDPTSILLIMVPLTYPVVSELGMNGIWFGLLFVKLIEIGLLTPPLGLNAFVVAGIRKDIEISTAFRGVLWYVRLDIVVVVLMFTFPAIVTFIPSQMGLSS